MRYDESMCATLLPLAYRLTGRHQMRMLRELVASEALDEEQLGRIQFARLRALLDHCYENVPYYRRLFDELDVKPQEITSLADYAQLPVLTKQALKENTDALIATNYDRKSLMANATGGSTGEPTQFYQDRRYLELGSAAFLRNLQWTGYRLGERHLYLWGAPWTAKVSGGERLRRFLLRRWVFSVGDLSDETMAQWTVAIQRIAPRTIYGYVTALFALAGYMKDRGIQIDGLRSVVTSAEALLPESKRVIETGFGCPVYDQYGSREVYSIAAQCRAGSMHVNSDINVVETVDLSQESAAVGASDIVVTPLFAYGMPLLRYANGDRGVLIEGRCDCGRPLPQMKTNIGRTMDNVFLRNGTPVEGLALVALLRGIVGIGRFQFRQSVAGACDLLIVKDQGCDASTERALAQAASTAADRLGVDLTINVRIVEDIPLTRLGKHNYVVSELAGARPTQAGRH